MKTLVYAGGATLTFGSGRATRRTVKAGEPFEVDDDLGRILLADPHVRLATADDVPRGTTTVASGPVTVADLGRAARGSSGPSALERHRALKARAKELGLPAVGKVADLEAAIAAEETRLAEEAAAAAATASSSGEGGQEGDVTPADDPDASATGEAGTPPADAAGGAIVLGTDQAPEA
jgi:hypothetical protein